MSEPTDQLTAAAREYLARQRHASLPDGSFDRKSRWTPSAAERQSCCKRIQRPSASYPFSLLTHCRTAVHVARLYGVDRIELFREARRIEAEEVTL